MRAVSSSCLGDTVEPRTEYTPVRPVDPTKRGTARKTRPGGILMSAKVI